MTDLLGNVFGAIGGKVLEVLLPTLITVVAGAIAGVLVRMFKRLGLELTREQEDSVRRTVADALKRVEEEARRSGQPLSGEQKRNRAAQIIREKAPRLDPRRVPELIDATLPELRAKLPPVPSHPGSFGR